MDLPRLAGERIVLRAPQLSDIEARLSYGTDPDIATMYGVSREHVSQPTREKLDAWLERELNTPYSWVIEVESEPAGVICLHRLNEEHRKAGVGIGMFHKRFMGKGYGSEAMRVFLKFAFEQLNLHRVELRVFEVNHRAIKSYESVGFVKEGLEQETTLVDGEWRNDVIMSILEHEFIK
jgi:RimJ/RimL family protein N-acetyltransferase